MIATLSEEVKNLCEEFPILQSAFKNLSIEIEYLKAQIKLLQKNRFGSSSEKLDSNQLALFECMLKNLESKADTLEKETEVGAHTRKKGGRRSLPENLPRIRIEHDLSEKEKICHCGCGKLRPRIGEEITEQLDVIPAEFRVLQHVRFKYGSAHSDGEGGVVVAPLPPQPLPKTNASPGLLAYVVTSKFVDALPLYRQEKIFSRYGVEISRGTLANYMIGASGLVQPLVNLFQDHLLEGPLIQMDETTIQVLKEEARLPQTKSYMWVARGGPPGEEVLIYRYDPSRGHEVPEKILEDYQGYLQVDGHKAYYCLESETLRIVNCWAHARRKFKEAIDVLSPGKKEGLAHEGMAFIGRLYSIEREIKKLQPEEKKKIRTQKAFPLLNEMRLWLDQAILQILPKSYTGKAIHYLNAHWKYLIRYLEEGFIPIDNNRVENAIRPFVVGRKNWLFSDTTNGAHASANLYSLVETAKIHGLEPYHYLKTLFEKLTSANTLDKIENLLPWNQKK